MFKFGAIKNWLQLSVSFIISFIASKNDSVFMLVTAQFKKYKKKYRLYFIIFISCYHFQHLIGYYLRCSPFLFVARYFFA